MSTCSVTINDYLREAGVSDERAPPDLDLVLVKMDGHTCWRMNGRFVFCPLMSPMNPHRDKIQAIIRTLRLKYHPDRAGGDDTVFCAISDLMKNGGPSDEAVVAYMCMLSMQFRAMSEQDLSEMKTFQLKQCIYTFMERFHHVYRAYNERVIGPPFIFLPGLEARFKYMVIKFVDSIRGVVGRLVVDGCMKTEVQELVGLIRSLKQNVSMVVERLLSLSQALGPVVISKYGAHESMVFSCAIHGLHKLLYTVVVTFKHDLSQLDAFKCRVLDGIKFDECDLVTRCTEPRHPGTRVQERPSKRPSKRPISQNRPKPTWREKRPVEINTDIEIHIPVVCERLERIEQKIRKSQRIAQLNPRRSSRFMKK
jgi:hypothetical protein